MLAEHRQLVRAAIAGHGGHEVDTQGDAFFAVFGEAKQAVLCALEVQRSLAAHDWPAGTQVRVRMGIHTGHCVPADGAYTGLAVHRAARICAAARGGQVLISQATQTLVEDEEEGEAQGFTLVRRLDGMPLAIELAAARVEALGVTQLLDRLDDRFDLLRSGAKGSSRIPRPTVGWSWYARPTRRSAPPRPRRPRIAAPRWAQPAPPSMCCC